MIFAIIKGLLTGMAFGIILYKVGLFATLSDGNAHLERQKL